jgi:hypothetical protein
MKQVVKILIWGLILACAVACNPSSKFAILETGELYFDGLTSVHTHVMVENSSRKNLTVENAALVFRYKTRELATAGLMLPVTVHAFSAERVRIDLRLEDTTLAALQTLERRATSNPDQLMVSVRAHVRRGKNRRVIYLKDVPFSTIISNFETTNQGVR